MQNDPFSDFLRLASAQSVMTGGLVAGGSWAMSIHSPGQIKFWGVVKGSCWLLMDEEDAPIQFADGDVFLTVSRSIVLAGDLNARPVALEDALRTSTAGVTRLGEGEEFQLIGGKVELEPQNGDVVLSALPPFIHVKAASRQSSALQWLLHELVRERQDELPGASAASAQLAHLMFIHILRAHLQTSSALEAGWVRAASDKRLVPALRLIHSDPGRAWQLEELAKASAMSRATFAAHFKTIAGVAPVAYLTAWRMRLAERALRDSRTSLNALATSLGYSSESAFSHAFKRVMGKSPKSARGALAPRREVAAFQSA